METPDLIRRREAVVARGVPRVSDFVVDSASGAILHTADGREVIDLATGIGVMSIGHSNARVVAAVQEQVQKLQHTCIHVATYEPYVALCEKLVELFPHGDEGTKVFLANSGAEAVENAVKIARQATGRPAVICYTEAFHGRTLMGMSLTSKAGYKVGCGPFAPEVYRLPFPNPYSRGDGLDEQAFVERELRRFRDALISMVPAQHVAAVVMEVIQGEGGFVPVPAGYLRGLREICDEHGILLVLDEVQAGFCRTGKWASYEHYGVTPDLSTWAKAMGSGLPISCVLGKASVMDAAAPGTIGGTYGGNPVACASALAGIGVMEELDLNARATAIGETIRTRLEALQAECPLVGDVRGLGAMMAMELVHDGDPHRPASEVAKVVKTRCHEQDVLVIGAGAHANIVRLLPPLSITEEQLDRALDVLTNAVLHAANAATATAGS